MIKRIIRFSAENRFLVLGAVAVLIVLAGYTLRQIRLDALPDLSDTQVIVYSRWDRSPDILEDQVTYPIIANLLGAPKVKAIRGYSDFGFSYVYVIFQDGTDLYWARSRVLEYLSKIQSRLPEGVQTELGPDATGVGWVYQYALVDREKKHSLDELRSYQDWTLRYALQSVPGVAEVASIGGYQRQYQVTVDPNRLAAYGLPIDTIVSAVRRSNNEIGGRLLELSGREFMVRGRGYAKSTDDLGQIVVKVAPGGVPVLLRDVANIELGPEIRRGVSDLDGEGDTVGGIVVMRHGENALNVIRLVEAKLADLKQSLPAGVEVVTTYDRSTLIERAIGTLKHELVVEMIIVSLVILFFLWHVPSAVVPILTIPISVLLAFIPMYLMGLTVNIMSLAGIAISIGVLVDGAIVEVENAYNKIHHWQVGGRKGSFHQVRLEALMEVGPSVFFSLLVIAVAFLPVFALVDQEGRLFKPLAFSKNLAMAIAALLAITLDPALRMMFARIDPFQLPAAVAGSAGDGRLRRYLPCRGASSDQPLDLPRLRAGLSLRPPPPQEGHRCGAAPGRDLRAGLFHPRLRVHAATQRRHHPAHAHDASGNLRGTGAGAVDCPGQGAARLPGGGKGLRQGGASRHVHRPGSVLDVRDHGGAEVRGRVASQGAVVLGLARLDEACLPPLLA